MVRVRKFSSFLKSLWKWVSHTHTLFGILQTIGLIPLAVGVITASSGVGLAIWRSYGPLAAFFMAVVGFPAGIWAVNGLTWMRDRNRTGATTTPVASVRLKRRKRSERKAVDDALNELIEDGRGLARRHRSGASPLTPQEDQSIQSWLDRVERTIWELVPECAGYVTSNERAFSEDAKLRYIGWDKRVAYRRMMIDRRLERLMEIRSKL